MAMFTIVRYERDDQGQLVRTPDGRCTVADRKHFESFQWNEAMLRAMAAGDDWRVALVGHEDRAPYSASELQPRPACSTPV